MFGIPVYVDRSLSRLEEINFNIGLRTHSASMLYKDYENFEKPNWNVFTDEEIKLGNLPKIEKTAPKK